MIIHDIFLLQHNYYIKVDIYYEYFINILISCVVNIDNVTSNAFILHKMK